MIKIFIESGVNAAQKKGSKRTTNEQNFVETLVAHYFPHAVLDTDYLVVDERFDNEKEKFNEVLNSGKYEIAYQEQGLISIYKKK